LHRVLRVSRFLVRSLSSLVWIAPNCERTVVAFPAISGSLWSCSGPGNVRRKFSPRLGATSSTFTQPPVVTCGLEVQVAPACQ
ncbi:hypothetical protein C8R47DRAFT_1197114, partial [Mycena vitilis]